MMLWIRGLVFTILVPAVIAGAVPYWIDPNRTLQDGWWRLGWPILGAGAAIYAVCLLRFLAAGGTPASPTAVAKALSNVQVQGVAGPIRLAANGFALANWHAWEVFNESSGTPYLVARERTLEEYAGPRVGSCRGKSG